MKKTLLFAAAIALSLTLEPRVVLTQAGDNFSTRLQNLTTPQNNSDFKTPFKTNSLTLKDRDRPIFRLAHREEETLAVPEGKAIPSVRLLIHPDARKGWNLELQVTHFKFAPEHVNQEGSYTEGHAHLYVNGKKITRIYGNWYYLASLEPGRNQLTVTLNANNHHTLTYKGAIIQDSQVIEVKAVDAQ